MRQELHSSELANATGRRLINKSVSQDDHSGNPMPREATPDGYVSSLFVGGYHNETTGVYVTTPDHPRMELSWRILSNDDKMLERAFLAGDVITLNKLRRFS